jgi:DNA (cytosine-5)-methyltransferase 1
MNELHLFAGAGGGILGGMLCGHTCVCAVEIEEYPRKVLLQRQRDGILPRFPIWGDVCTFDGRPWRGIVDVVCGGFPCQDISSSGTGAGLDGERSGLWAEMLRVIGEVRPAHVLTENSPTLTTRGGLRVIAELAAMGYDSSWGIIGAKHCGGAIARDRMWIYSCSREINREGDTERKAKLYGWPYKVGRNLGDNWKTRSPVDRFVEELEQSGERREKQGKCDLPPYLFRVDDGMAYELDELAAIGNGQVPVVAATAWQILKRALNDRHHQTLDKLA